MEKYLHKITYKYNRVNNDVESVNVMDWERIPHNKTNVYLKSEMKTNGYWTEVTNAIELEHTNNKTVYVDMYISDIDKFKTHTTGEVNEAIMRAFRNMTLVNLLKIDNYTYI